MTLEEVYKSSLNKLKNKDAEEINIRILLCYINKLKSMSDFYIHLKNNILDLQTFYDYFRRYLSGEPIQYILNQTEFFGLKFYVDKRVLIPRQETEELVDFAIKTLSKKTNNKSIDVLDVCTGSGCIGISFSKNFNVNKLYLSDISSDAINVAKINLKELGIKGECFVGDALDPALDKNIKVDVIFANPPYILNKNDVDEGVLKYEPEIALFTDEKLFIYKKIFLKLQKIKKEKLYCFFEIGYDLKEKLTSLIKEVLPISKFEFCKDINNKNRILFIEIE